MTAKADRNTEGQDPGQIWRGGGRYKYSLERPLICIWKLGSGVVDPPRIAVAVFVPLQPWRYEVHAPYTVLVRASPWSRRDQGALSRGLEHRYPWPPGRAKGAAASAHAATGGASAAGSLGGPQLGADFGAQSARSTGPGFWAGAQARATWSKSHPQPWPRTKQPGARAQPGCAWPSA